ncbi:MAG: DNA-directed RNA polymerase subunit omega [Oscillospiraceae bacterium]
MLRPAITQMITKNESYYSLVIGVAKRARQITEELYNKNAMENSKEAKEGATSSHDYMKTSKEDNEIKKPVKMAVDDIASGRYKIIECNPDEDINTIIK